MVRPSHLGRVRRLRRSLPVDMASHARTSFHREGRSAEAAAQSQQSDRAPRCFGLTGAGAGFRLATGKAFDPEPLLTKPPAEESNGDGALRILGTGVGFFLAAVILTASVIFFRVDRPILWPPPPETTVKVGYWILGTFFAALLLGLVLLAANIIAVLAGRITPWRFWGGLLQVLIMVAITLGAIKLAVSAFYWPWAKASALYTVGRPSEAVRLKASAALLRDRWSESVRESLEKLARDEDPSKRFAANWVLASAGRENTLDTIIETALLLPDKDAIDTTRPVHDRGYAREEALQLLNDITSDDWESIEEIEEAAGLHSFQWHPETGRYSL